VVLRSMRRLSTHRVSRANWQREIDPRFLADGKWMPVWTSRGKNSFGGTNLRKPRPAEQGRCSASGHRLRTSGTPSFKIRRSRPQAGTAETEGQFTKPIMLAVTWRDLVRAYGGENNRGGERKHPMDSHGKGLMTTIQIVRSNRLNPNTG